MFGGKGVLAGLVIALVLPAALVAASEVGPLKELKESFNALNSYLVEQVDSENPFTNLEAILNKFGVDGTTGPAESRRAAQTLASLALARCDIDGVESLKLVLDATSVFEPQTRVDRVARFFATQFSFTCRHDPNIGSALKRYPVDEEAWSVAKAQTLMNEKQ